jgi:FMN phosphatase YigB (HAD superfamily)
MKGNFYIFLDIDGVLWDWKFLLSKKATNTNRGIMTKFNPESIKALNFLISETEKEYDTKLVLSSTWRYYFEKAKKILQNNNVLKSENLDKTPSLRRRQRGLEILKYLQDHKYNKEKDKFLIIDNQNFDFKKYFKQNKIIKTSIMNNSLSQEMVESHLQPECDIEK